MLKKNSTHMNLKEPSLNGSQITMIGNSHYGFYQEKILGQGFGGVIYQGIDVNDSSPIAVKILNAHSLLQNHIPLKDLTKLTSKNINSCLESDPSEFSLVSVFDVIFLDKTFIIMQLCDCNLFEFLQTKKSFPEQQILSIFNSITQALIEIDQKGYHFADLKPQNILIGKNGQAKLGDLESLIVLPKLNQNITLKFHHTIFGTLRYMAPELIGLGQHSSKNYIWSLGVILHQIIYGHPPFDIETYQFNLTEEQKITRLNSFYQHLFRLKIRQDLSKEYQKSHILINKMLRLNAKNRINLHQIISIIQYQNKQDPNKNVPNLVETNKSRSNSQNTIDTSDDHKSESGDYPIKLQNRKKSYFKSEQNNQNQKQFQSQNFHLKSELNLNKAYFERNAEFFKSFKQKFENETIRLMGEIERPSVLVRKLKEFQEKMSSLLEQMQRSKKEWNPKDDQKAMKGLKEEIRGSKLYSHLKTTNRIEHLSGEQQKNFQQANLWKNLNSLISMTECFEI